MPINVYTGLMGSGKSYEVVAEVIVPAIAQGRRVVTNVDGIDQEKIHAYIEATYSPVPDVLGEVLHVTNGDVFGEKFFPYYDDAKEAHTDTTVQPGDLVCIDEAWRFWPATGAKIPAQHKSFFLEHRHFTNEKTGVACDLVLMIQDMGTLNRFVKNVVAFNARTHKKVSLGMPNTYSVTMYEGYKQTKTTKISTAVRKYRKEVFPLYSSFKGGAAGKSVNVDKRQNMFGNRGVLLGMVATLVVGVAGLVWSIRFFSTKHVQPDEAKTNNATAAKAAANNSPSSAPPKFSEVWRLVGSVEFGSARYLLIADSAGRLRYESPSMFVAMGPQTIGDIDGAKVTRYSGSVLQPGKTEIKK
ncbi:zonula occludens toxin [Herbaspirillum sp. CF444]|nr:zonula occludens toxin [Herbaspirillum sp. CF444]